MTTLHRIFSLCLMFLTALAAFSQGTIDLKGYWQFRMDADDKGESQGWYNADCAFNDSILLPGSMPQRMKGYDISVQTKWVGAIYDSSYFHNPFMEQYRRAGKDMKLPFFLTPDKHYVGKAWYKKTLRLPANGSTAYSLFLERPHISTTVWVNGRKVTSTDGYPSSKPNSRNSLSVPHVFDISNELRHGENTIAICVDNDPMAANVGQDSHSVTDQTQGDWNGIVGRMELIPCSYINKVRVFPDVDNRKAVAKLELTGLQGSEDVTVTVSAESFNTAKRHIIVSTPVKATLTEGSSTPLEVTLDMGDEMLLWDEFCPQMYRLNVEVKTKKRTSTAETYFGMRKIEIRGKRFYVNDRQIQLRGTLENCCFPLTGYPPTDLDSWLNLFQTCKKWGLNHVRFHSYCPPEAAFLAADLVGMYIQPEGPSWPNHGVKLGRGEYIDTYLFDESRRIVDEYGNHPSFTFFAFGNEPAGNWVKWCNEKVPLMREYDPRHLYCGFSVGGGWAWQPAAEYAVKAGARGLDSWKSSHPESTADFSAKINTYNGKDMPGTPITIPFVSHETGQWCAFPNFAETSKYTGVNKAKNFDIFRDLLKAGGMENRAQQFLMASGKLQSLCYKYELERHLRTPDYAGFQLLGLNDYSGQGSALVGLTDVFYGEKGYITAPEFREYCSPIVPLAKIKKFTYTADETFEADIELSQFSDDIITSATPHWEIRREPTKQGSLMLLNLEAPYAEGDFSTASLPIGQNISLGSISVPLNGITKAGKYTLTVNIPGTEARNHWDFWVYPQDNASAPKLKRGKRSGTVFENGIYVSDSLDAQAMKVLRKGGSVLILAAGKISYGKEVKQYFTPVFWNTSWFKMRPPHTTGLYIESEHPIFANFPTDYHSDLQWWELANRAQVMQFTDFPQDFQPLVQSIDTWFVSRKIGMLFEANVLGGKLVMTTMDLTTDLDKRHAARQMRRSIMDYMCSDAFNPQFTIAQERIADLFTKVAGEVNMYTNDSPDELKPKLK
ncbi:MAG: beta-glucuronidase [Prevotellaceae bacterium]|nr:beta-glucuronidase [Prevotellaceae bacterium]MDY2749122.1 beta-glucuronidase [Prevotella sp.]